MTSYETPDFNPAGMSTAQRLELLEAKSAFLLDEVSQLRSLVRHLVAEKVDSLPMFQQTRDSFDYQWGNLPEGHAMLSNPAWKATAGEQIVRSTGLPADWFAGKRVLDAGCGQGRWSYGLGTLGVSSLVAVDISEHGTERTREVVKEFGSTFEVQRKNLLQDLGLAADFDFVWCFGVLHHTGDTYRGFRNVARCVKPSGYLFLMLYTEPRPDRSDEYRYYHEMFDMRCRLRNLPFAEKISRLEKRYGKELLHGYFDAISPDINDLYRWDEIVSWLHAAGFEDVKRTQDHPNHHLIARRRVTSAG